MLINWSPIQLVPRSMKLSIINQPPGLEERSTVLALSTLFHQKAEGYIENVANWYLINDHLQQILVTVNSCIIFNF